MNHWAEPLIGRPWSPFYQCWDTVREAYLLGFNHDLPPIRIGGHENADSIRGMMNAWRLVDGQPEEGDIVLMSGPSGRHVGLIIKVGRRLLLLHNPGCVDRYGTPHGSVVAQPIQDAHRDGYKNFEIWRKE